MKTTLTVIAMLLTASLFAAPITKPSTAKIGKLRVTPTPSGTAREPRHVELSLLGGNLESDVKRGENRGRKLRHDFAVLHFATAALTNVEGRYTASLPLPEKTTDAPIALAAWINAGNAKPPIQAVGGWLK